MQLDWQQETGDEERAKHPDRQHTSKQRQTVKQETRGEGTQGNTWEN